MNEDKGANPLSDHLLELQLHESQQAHDHVRTIMQLVVAWITFFMTVQIGAVAWALTNRYSNEGTQFRGAIWFVTIFYIVQNILGIMATMSARKSIRRIRDRIARILAGAGTLIEDDNERVPSGYEKSLRLTEWSLYSSLVGQVALMILAALFKCPS
ncbi:MAG: hypothetical protein D3906_15190 [Candidatus Electrothrix sp. AUS1_2]|nr:hypothetical protein [Candidatus Electrothrix sp. AUS1_2]